MCSVAEIPGSEAFQLLPLQIYAPGTTNGCNSNGDSLAAPRRPCLLQRVRGWFGGAGEAAGGSHDGVAVVYVATARAGVGVKGVLVESLGRRIPVCNPAADEGGRAELAK